MTNLNNILISRPEHQKSLFVKAVGKNGKAYYYNSNPMSVWVEDGEGCSGRTIAYEMLEGDTEYVKGPWNSNADDLLKQTGVDVTENYYSFGVVVKRSDVKDFMDGKEVELVVSDSDWTKGKYEGAVSRMHDALLKAGLDYLSNDMMIVFFNQNGTPIYKSVMF